jgi:hypothetical protein
MKSIYSSATKTVFVLMAISTIAMVFMGIITGEQFLPLITMVFLSYYKTPSNTSQG